MSGTIFEALRSGLAAEMATDPRVVALGEDIGIGGSFHLTLGLLDRFGADRILDTPVSEAGFVGLAIGAAISGMRPVVDFQYGDFLVPAADQIIQQASKFRLMSGGRCACRSSSTRPRRPRVAAPSTPTQSRTSSTACPASSSACPPRPTTRRA